MHMADALISPAVGGTMWAVTAGLASYSTIKVQNDLDERKIPLMGVLGAFIFAAQMINFTIPGTGSSGHLGGGLILAILLGPYAGFLTISSILIIQALFFADGGLLALGCNIFNLGFFPCFIAYPLIFKPLNKKGFSQSRIFFGSMIAATIGLQLGAFSVVLETLFSGISDLPFKTFLLLMQPIHLAIGLVEGFVTATVVGFIRKARPEILEKSAKGEAYGKIIIKQVLIGLIIAMVFTGGVLSWFASAYPDGLEWSMFHTSGKEELTTTEKVHQSMEDVQKRTSFFPDYSFKENKHSDLKKPLNKSKVESKETWPNVNGGTTVSGLVGGALTLLLAGLIGVGLHLFKKKSIKVEK